jgi:site-specific DNA-methyltransferase (cytosine-N4-specific)
MQLHTIRYSTHPVPILLPSIQKEDDVVKLFSTVVTGNALDVLRSIPNGYVHSVITSPPYWSLRNYGVPGQIGLEDNVNDYIAALVGVFEEVRRVLSDRGTLWLNIGDSYTSGGRTWRAPDKKNPVRAMNTRPPTPEGLKSKELVGIPWKLAFALQQAGWYLRSDIIWHKPNAMPESVKDRPTRSHEYVFLFTKAEQYFYDNSAVREAGRSNLRSVWNINTRPFSDAHFATFPPELVEKCLLLGSKVGDIICDPFMGSGTVGVVTTHYERAFLGIELNPEYVEVTRRRFGKINNELEFRIEYVG